MRKARDRPGRGRGSLVPGGRSRFGRAGLAPAGLAGTTVAAGGCQAALTEHNPASSAIWWVGGAMFLVLVLILAVELSEGLVAAWRRRRGPAPPPGPVSPGDTFRPREQRRPLRRRHFRRVRPIRRTWGEGRSEAEPEAER